MSAYKKVLDKIRRCHLLHGAMIELTYQCNLNCVFCYNNKSASSRSLHLDNYFSLLHDLASMQVLFLALTGGEPLCHPFFFEIAGMARKLGFVIRIKSNGLLIKGKVARRLKEEVNPLRIELSLHGATSRSHDQQTRVAGSFALLLNNVKEMRAIGLRPSFVSTLTSWNEAEIEEMFSLADKLGADLRFQGPVGPRGGSSPEDWQKNTLHPSAESWKTVGRMAGGRAERKGQHHLQTECGSDEKGVKQKIWCGAGSQEILIDPFGNVFPCLHLRWLAGNLHDSSISNIWQRGKGDVFVQARQLSRKTCKRMQGRTPEQFGAPLFCPGVDLQSVC
jgi:MoaA/NifB/PqqE/SkfB family radical SAM enzyme